MYLASLTKNHDKNEVTNTKMILLHFLRVSLFYPTYYK